MKIFCLSPLVIRTENNRLLEKFKADSLRMFQESEIFAKVEFMREIFADSKKEFVFDDYLRKI